LWLTLVIASRLFVAAQALYHRRPMPEHVRRPRQRRRSRSTLATTRTLDARGLIDRILTTPHLEHVVPRLEPEVLHRVIQHCGLQACAELVALATPDQLRRVFDLDVWRARTPGLDEQFDADRFGAWIEALVEHGVSVAARTLAALDAGLVIAALSQHVRVFDCAAVTSFMLLDGEESLTGSRMDGLPRCDVGGFVVVAARSEYWGAITDVLAALEEEHGARFHQIMCGCRRLSNSRPEVDGLDDLMNVGDQVMFDLAIDREQRRGTQGFVTPAEARAFLQAARRIDLRHGTAQPVDVVGRAHFHEVTAEAASSGDKSLGGLRASPPAEAPDLAARAVEELVELVREAGALPRAPRALLDNPRGSATRSLRIHGLLQFVRAADSSLFSRRTGELAFLSNAIVAGASVQARPFSPDEASRAALAVCNLGLENWPDHWSATPDDFLLAHDLVALFEVGWTVLHENVCTYTADRLVYVLASFRCDDSATQEALDSLRVAMTRQLREGTPWRARDALDVIAILDMPAWAALLALTDEFPVLHTAVGASLTGSVRQVEAAAFEFFAENHQIAMVRDFMQLLPRRLR